MKAIISIAALAMTFASVLAQELRGGPAVLSDVTPADANSEGSEWHPKAEFVPDIHKENGETKLVGDGRKWDHKTKIHKENGMTKLIAEGHKQYHKTKEVEGFIPALMEGMSSNCLPHLQAVVDCMSYEPLSVYEIENCANCLVYAWGDVGEGVYCDKLQEVGFCGDVADCEIYSCGHYCTAELNYFVGCFVHYDGCNHDQYWSECFTGI